MKLIGLKLTTQSPLLLAAKPPSHNLIETTDFIPGNSVRGLLAHQYMNLGGKPGDKEFQRLFLSGETIFGFAYIEDSQIIPLSARSCKYEGGFTEDKGHGVIDLLLAVAGEMDCSTCAQSIDYFEGFWDPITYKKKKVRKRLITRTAIDPVLGTAGSGQLYSQKVIEEGQSFLTAIEVPDDDLAAVLEKLISSPFVAGLGTGRSRGQGWVEVTQESLKESFNLLSWGTARNRFDRFKSRLACQAACQTACLTDKPLLAVTLLSDAIFHDDYLRDCTAPSLLHLEPLGINPEEWNPILSKAFASGRMAFGFDGVPVQLPRVPRLAVTAGSVFLFEAADNVTGNVQPTIPDGNGIGWIGDNNAEGFGRAILWHPFHIEQEREIEQEWKQEHEQERERNQEVGL